jgi:hypothetical protein
MYKIINNDSNTTVFMPRVSACQNYTALSANRFMNGIFVSVWQHYVRLYNQSGHADLSLKHKKSCTILSMMQL